MKATDYFLSTYSSTIYLKGVYGLLIKDGQLGDFVNNNWSYSSDTGQLKLDLAVSRNRDMYIERAIMLSIKTFEDRYNNNKKLFN